MQPIKPPARIIRFVSPNDLYPGHYCEYDKEKNILKINRELYQYLTPQQKQKIFRATDTIASF